MDIVELWFKQYCYVVVIIAVIVIIPALVTNLSKANRDIKKKRPTSGDIRARKAEIKANDLIVNDSIVVRGIALGAFANALNWFAVKHISFHDVSPKLSLILKQAWQVFDYDQAVAAVNQLLTLEHSTSLTESWAGKSSKVFDEATEKISQNLNNYAAINVKDLAAWDIARAANVAQWSYMAGLISLDELKAYLTSATELSRTHYENWQDFGFAFLVARDLDGFPNANTAPYFLWFLGQSKNDVWKSWENLPF